MFPIMENKLYATVFGFVCLFQLFVGEADAQMKFKALDSYDNVRVEVTLSNNGEYVYEERFLDGSHLRDSGFWKRQGNYLKFYSNNRSRREHGSIRYKARKKFKGETFEIKEQELHFVPKLKRAGSNYFKGYRWHVVEYPN